MAAKPKDERMKYVGENGKEEREGAIPRVCVKLIYRRSESLLLGNCCLLKSAVWLPS